ncbi:MAG: VacJ family lipoprotein [Deferribacterota bacterium]|nr:VacJ family lipoprotein [Deferribacterota bacterium]
MRKIVKKLSKISLFMVVFVLFSNNILFAQYDNNSYYSESLLEELDEEYTDEDVIADPLEPFNRAMFYFNDKLYFYLLKPVAQGYSFVVPEPIREHIDKAFYNARTPIRFVNDILQLKFDYAGRELGRFVVNSTVGLLGLFEPADKISFLEEPPPKDTDLTFGSWGIGHGVYIVWPLLGPNTIRSTVGLVGDSFLYPINYIDPWWVPLTINSTEHLNRMSLKIGEYEDLKEQSLDPYTALKQGYIDYREEQLKK